MLDSPILCSASKQICAIISSASVFHKSDEMESKMKLDNHKILFKEQRRCGSGGKIKVQRGCEIVVFYAFIMFPLLSERHLQQHMLMTTRMIMNSRILNTDNTTFHLIFWADDEDGTVGKLMNVMNTRVWELTFSVAGRDSMERVDKYIYEIQIWNTKANTNSNTNANTNTNTRVWELTLTAW